MHLLSGARMSRNLRNIAVAFAERILGALTGAVGMFFLARQMPDADFHIGVVGFGLSFVGMFIAVQRAFDDAHTKRVSEGRDLGTCNGTYLLLNIASTTAMIALVAGALLFWTQVLGRGFQSQFHLKVLELVIVYHVLNSIGEYTRRTYQGQQNIFLGQVILSTEHVIKGAATIYVAFFGLEPLISNTHNALGIATAYVAGAWALAMVAVALMIGQPIGKPSWELAKSYARYGFPTTATATITMVATNAGAVILQLFWSARDVSYFFAPTRYLQFLPALAGAANTTFFPIFSSLHAEGQTAPRTLERMLRAVSLLLLPVVAVSMVLPEGIIHVLLSDQFLPAAPVMAILAAGFYVKAFRQMIGSKLGGINRPGEVTKASLISATVSVVAGVILVAPSLFGVRLFGLRAVGAAIALALAQLAGFSQVVAAARTHAGVRLSNLRANMVRQLIMFLATVAALWGMAQVVDPLTFRFYHLAIAAVLAWVAFFGTGFVVGELHKDDAERVWRAVHPSEWASFLRQESSRGRDDLPDEEQASQAPEDGEDTDR